MIFDKFIQAVIDRRYEYAKSLLLECMEYNKRWRRKVGSNDIPFQFMKEMMEFIEFKEKQKRQFYEDSSE